MHAGLPMVVTARKEVAAIVREHGLGEVVQQASPAALRGACALSWRGQSVWSKSLQSASDQFHWGVDEPRILAHCGHLLERPLATATRAEPKVGPRSRVLFMRHSSWYKATLKFRDNPAGAT